MSRWERPFFVAGVLDNPGLAQQAIVGLPMPSLCSTRGILEGKQQQDHRSFRQGLPPGTPPHVASLRPVIIVRPTSQ